MAYIATLDQLVEECREHLDSDPRFFDQDTGSFRWWAWTVFFTKGRDEVTLEVDGETVTYERP